MAPSKRRKKPEELRSHKWYGVDDLNSFGHRSRTQQMGYSREDFAGKPVIAIINTWSDINPCHRHSGQSAEEVKRDTWRPAFSREFEAGNPAVPLVPQLLQ